MAVRNSFSFPTSIWPGAEASFTEPKVRQEPNTSPDRRLMSPVPFMDMVITYFLLNFAIKNRDWLALWVADRRVRTSPADWGITAILAMSAPRSSI